MRQAISILGLIPARGGSVRLPGKNLRLLHGLSLLNWTISCAICADCFLDIAVTSDSDEILAEAFQEDVITIKRPASLATAEASVYDAIRHAYQELANPYTIICLLQPTSPVRMPSDILACLGALLYGDSPAAATRSEDAFVPNGAVYAAYTSWLLDGGNWDAPSVSLVPMPAERSIDINTLEDFQAAEAVIGARFARAAAQKTC